VSFLSGINWPPSWKISSFKKKKRKEALEGEPLVKELNVQELRAAPMS
jgi:hypothetical protein